MPVLPLQVFDDLLQASPFRCHVGLHRLHAGVPVQMGSAWASTRTAAGRGMIS